VTRPTRSYGWTCGRSPSFFRSAVDLKRYYPVMFCDGNAYNYGYIGTRATGSEPGDYMVVGPDWKGATPPGIKEVFRSSTQFSLAGYRTQVFNPDDLDNVKKVQAGYKAQMLSAYLNQPPPPPAPAIGIYGNDAAEAMYPLTRVKFDTKE
jgi:hypothetical protein